MEQPSNSPMVRILPILLGVVIGIAGLLIAQKVLNSGEGSKFAAGPAPSASIEQLEQDLAQARAESERLGRENRKIKGDLAAAKKSGGIVAATAVADDETEKEVGLGKDMLKAMMEFGAQDAKRKVEAEVAELAARLNLTEAQQEEIRAALLARLEKQQAAGLLMMQGKATIEDLASSDEDNFLDVDSAMMKILSESQMEEYAAYQHEREEKRVEKKANEDLDGLHDIADLTDQQADLAWDLFVELNAADKPGEIPEGTTMADFEGYIDEAIQKRIDGLASILNPEQLEAYRGQTAQFRAMIVALISGGTGGK